jgi:hypothetical protein
VVVWFGVEVGVGSGVGLSLGELLGELLDWLELAEGLLDWLGVADALLDALAVAVGLLVEGFVEGTLILTVTRGFAAADDGLVVIRLIGALLVVGGT